MIKDPIAIPTKEDVVKLLSFAVSDNGIQIQTIGELLGMKLIDSFLPKSAIEPNWGYDGLKKFFAEHNIAGTDTINTALEKLTNQK